MSATLIDASAVLAAVLGEPGGERVRPALRGGAITAVNAAEVVGKLVDAGQDGATAEAMFLALMLETRDFTAAAGCLAGRLRAATRHAGLSLADRACLAEAQLFGLAVMTADRAWAGLDLGLDIEVIR